MKAIVVGGSGYTGGELLRILARHPRVEKITTTSRTYEGEPVTKTHPNLEGVCEIMYEKYREGVDAELAFLALPHGQSMDYVPGLLENGVKVVDMSADYRLADENLYEKYYVKHRNPELLGKAVYGLPEINRGKIKKAELVANPGCYSSAAILSILPMKKYPGQVDKTKIVVDAKSGTSGAGAKPTHLLQHANVEGNMIPYKVTGHRHEPEINHILGEYIHGVRVSFTPQLVPIVRGILSCAHIFCDAQGLDLKAHYRKYYGGEKFVRVVETATVKDVAYSNYCNISVHQDPNETRVVVVSAIDNLIKGAAGQAVQNMNLMMGWDESTSVDDLPYNP